MSELVPHRTKSIPVVASKEIDHLKKEVSDYKTNELTLQQIIKDQKKSFFFLKGKLETNPSYHILEYLKDKIEAKLNNLKELFFNKLKQQANKTEILINENNKTYAEIVSVNVADTSGNSVSEIKEAFRSAQIEDLDEAKRRAVRSQNIIIHG